MVRLAVGWVNLPDVEVLTKSWERVSPKVAPSPFLKILVINPK